jgi:hypothetical protein
MKNFLFLIGFIGLSLLFFGLAIDNGFWHGYDFVSLEHNLRLIEHPSAIFDSTPPFRFQPLVYGIHYLLFRRFFFDPRGYHIFNIILHGFNSFLVYLLVQTLLKDRAVALLSGLLFVFTVGSYGKSVMMISGFDDIIITALTLLTMLFYFKNEISSGGKVYTPWFLLSLIFFILSMFTSSTSLAILGAFLAFNFFFRRDTQKPVLSSCFLVLLVFALAALIVKSTVFHYTPHFYRESIGPAKFIYYAVKNVINYLVRMIFPIHTSHLVSEAGQAVRFIYRFATQIRILIALTVISYSVFGFIFGNRTIRFFIAWTYIMVLPFAFFQFPTDWLDIRHLYLVSVGFVVILSAGGVYTSRLISRHRLRRFVPILVPVFFILISRFIVTQLDRNYEFQSKSGNAMRFREEIAKKYPAVILEAGELRFTGEGE